MKKINIYLNYEGNETTLGACDVAYIGDFASFCHICEQTHTVKNGVVKNGVYEWDDSTGSWHETSLNTAMQKTIDKIVDDVKNFDAWNIIITLNNDDEIKTNDEPITMVEVYEAIDTMRKPSFFGKRIKEIRIVSEF